MRSSSLKPQAFTHQLTEEDEEMLYRRWKGYSFPPLSRFWSIQAPDRSIQTFDFSRSRPFYLVEKEDLYKQLSTENFYSSYHVSTNRSLCQVTSPQLSFLSSCEPSLRDDIDPRLKVVPARRPLLIQLCARSSAIHYFILLHFSCARTLKAR